MNKYFLYILECSNGSFYTGYTTNIKKRYAEHTKGTKKCKYTRSFPPKNIAASWPIGNDLSLTLSLEKKIKKLTKQQKIALIKHPDTLHTLA